uniref:Exonuclease domain-containing protein n=1 Tax=Trichogramma kaykai TaxID=54128 RepID=A0ABD2XAY9_9HYME
MEEIIKNLRCKRCKDKLHLEDTIKEIRSGLASVFVIICSKCTIHSGIGHTKLSKLLACLNVPAMSDRIFKICEEQVGQVIEKTAHESCILSAEEERQLVIENVEKICEYLPEEIAADVYGNLRMLRSSTENSTSSTDCNNNSNAFNEAVGNIINIIVSFEMGWSKRGKGRSYDSLNGYATIIGYLSGKIIDFKTYNRKCYSCDKGHDQSDHNCRKNYVGSAKSMEAAAGDHMINNSNILKEVGLNARVVIGDEDSSSIAKIRKNNSKTIYKLIDTNHRVKNHSKELYELAKTHKELNRKGVIKHLKKCLSYAVSQNRGQTAKLAKIILSIPDHVFGQHENCGEWCKKDRKKHTIELKSEELYNALKSFYTKYSINAYKFAVPASSQANESVNNIIAQKAPNSIYYSRSASADYRVANAVCTKNDGEMSLLNIKKNLDLSSNLYTSKYVSKTDNKRYTRAATTKTQEYKTRRIELTQNRENLRKLQEKSERITYASNCAMDMPQPFQEPQESTPSCNPKNIIESDFVVVYFDIETTSLALTAGILQIAAKSHDLEFSVYLNPTQAISPDASKITGLTIIGDDLYLHNTRLDNTLDLYDAFIALAEFLHKMEKPVLLVAHNATFDTQRILRAIIENNLSSYFDMIIGFVDTIPILKKSFPERKGPKAFKLASLANDLLGTNKEDGFHEALFEVVILEKLVLHINKQDELIKYLKPYNKCYQKQSEYDFIQNNMKYLESLRQVVSRELQVRMVRAGFSRSFLLKKLKEEGEKYVLDLLSEKMADGKPKITKNNMALTKIMNDLKK